MSLSGLMPKVQLGDSWHFDGKKLTDLNGRDSKLSTRAILLLRYLLQHTDEQDDDACFSHDRLLDQMRCPDGNLSDVTTAVFYLRRKLGDDTKNEFYIRTIRKHGYRWGVAGIIALSETPTLHVQGKAAEWETRDPILERSAAARASMTRRSREVEKVLLLEYPSEEIDRVTASKAATAWITGLNLARIGPSRLAALKKLLLRGGKVNVLMLSPACDALAYGMQQDYGPSASVTKYRNMVAHARDAFLKLQREHPGRVTIRTIDFPLTFGLDAIDTASVPAEIYVLFYPLFSEDGDKPAVKLLPAQHKLHGFYRAQLERQWKQFSALYHLPHGARVEHATTDDIPDILRLAHRVDARGANRASRGYLHTHNEKQYVQLLGAKHFYTLRRGRELVAFLLAHTAEQIPDFDSIDGGLYQKAANGAEVGAVIVRQIAVDPDERHRRKGYGEGLYKFLFEHSDLDTTAYSRALCVIWQDNKVSGQFHSHCRWTKLGKIAHGQHRGHIWGRSLP